ncbi:ATP-binding protein [Arthrobacter sp. 7Tela_A1]|uniref:ATP-binding protein n=1 Tax=Arthrobacter sp. 7Tela_A1 TaxID=3093745 RepID=UPI003BB513B2
MTRGELRVFLGAAPGVGKTYTMLEEGHRLRSEGRDVVVALVETHGRAATAAAARGLEQVPQLMLEHRGLQLQELDLDAVLARHPDYALVDELAHSNAPGLAHSKRWQDVQALLDAGINVLSTVNIQHIDSLNDVVEGITGTLQRETVPDDVLRAANQIELVDIAPEQLRGRLAEGIIYPAARVDAALSNYFRVGNLTALRELALLWLADEVDSALNRYRNEKGIRSKWEARERVVVALTGGPEGQTLLRRGARIAARSAGGELLAVHVTNPDGLRETHPGELAVQRALVEKLGGSFHQVVGSDIPGSLVDFARSANATQLVIGVSRRPRLRALFGAPGIGATVIRLSGDIDVHIVNHGAAGGHRGLPRLGGALSARRRAAGFALALAGGPLLTWLLVGVSTPESITSDVLAYQLLVILVALAGGIWPALFAALLSGVTLDYFFIDPLYTVTVSEPLHLFALVLYAANAMLVSFVVDRAARRSRAARRAASESDLLAAVAGNVLRGEDAVEALVGRVREAFNLTAARLRSGDTDLAVSGIVPPAGRPAHRIEVGEAVLELYGRIPDSADLRLLEVTAAQLAAALDYRDLSAMAEGMGPLAAADRVRTALLAAVGHDLRRPLTAATAAVTSLRAEDVAWSERDQQELLATAEESLHTLSELVTSLLDVSRLQAGALAVSLVPLEAADAVLPALEELGMGPAEVQLDLAPGLPPVLGDAVLLQRVLVNVLANAVRFSPPDAKVLLTASEFGGTVELRVIDCGPGISPERGEELFVPFQRLGDTDNTTGLGLGLAVAKGFMEGMGGTLETEKTPGGGLTMVLSLPAAPVSRHADPAAAL